MQIVLSNPSIYELKSNTSARNCFGQAASTFEWYIHTVILSVSIVLVDDFVDFRLPEELPQFGCAEECDEKSLPCMLLLLNL